jgi:hypothetical protein
VTLLTPCNVSQVLVEFVHLWHKEPSLLVETIGQGLPLTVLLKEAIRGTSANLGHSTMDSTPMAALLQDLALTSNQTKPSEQLALHL